MMTSAMRKIKLSFGRDLSDGQRLPLYHKTKVWGKEGNKYKTFDAARKIEVKCKE